MNRWIKKQEVLILKNRKNSEEENLAIDAVNKKHSSRLGEIAKIFSVSHQTISDRLKLLGVTRKKNFFIKREMKKRFCKISYECLNKIVYIDESGLKNSLTDEYGWRCKELRSTERRKGELQKN